MVEYTLSRRQFLRSTTRIGLTFAMASALIPPTRTARADEGSVIPIIGGLDILSKPDVQEFLGAGIGALWVAGSYLNTFAYNLEFNNLPSILKVRFLSAGGEYKGLPAAEAFWKTIPAPVRAGGPDAVWKFLATKDWSHFIPKSWGGPTNAENGIWWSSAKNRSLGPNPMSPADIADAKAVLRSDAIRATMVQTISGMVKGAMLAVVVAGVLACLECGLEFAEGKITWQEMVRKVLERCLVAGAAALIVTGLIVGLSLLFPILIPILLPIIFVVQIASLIFLGKKLVLLAKGWWKVLNGQALLDSTVEVLGKARSSLRSILRDVEESSLGVAWDWISETAERVGLDRAWEIAAGLVQRLGLDGALIWFASQTNAVTGKAAELASALKSWGYLTEVDVDVSRVKESIANVVTSQFQEAISTTNELLVSISDYRKEVPPNVSDSLLVA